MPSHKERLTQMFRRHRQRNNSLDIVNTICESTYVSSQNISLKNRSGKKQQRFSKSFTISKQISTTFY
jgi:hypothetical protein